jgi:type IV secretory pathway TraG/TraD family ATPase VirD4
MTQQTAQSPFSSQTTTIKILPHVYPQIGLFLLVLIGFIGIKIHQSHDRRHKKRLGRARFATKKEFQRSQQRTASSIRKDHRRGKFKEIGGWIVQPKPLVKDTKTKALHFGPTKETTLIGRLNEHLLVIAGTGGGKDYSVFNPWERSMADQGFGLQVFDYKGDEESANSCSPSSALAGYVLNRGGTAYSVAPGFQDSDVCNLLDYVVNATTALKLASVAHANMNPSNTQEKESGFFSNAGKILMQGLFLYAKYIGEQMGIVADIALCHKILALPNLIVRIQNATLPQYIKVIFDQFISTAGSPETAASIAATAQGIFARFQIPEAWATFCGKSTMPIMIGANTIVTYRMNPLIEDAIAPLMACSIYMQATANIFGHRSGDTPLAVSLNEFCRFKFPGLSGLMKVARSKRVVFGLAAQDIPTIEETFGKVGSQALLAACKTEFVGQLICKTTAKHYSESYGKEDIRYFSQSQSGSFRSGTSNTDSDGLTTRDLVPIEDLLEAPRGTFYMRSPTITGKSGGRKRERMLVRLDIKIPESDLNAVKAGEATWMKYRNARMKSPVALSLTEQQLTAREKLAEYILPMPQNAKSHHLPKLLF